MSSIQQLCALFVASLPFAPAVAQRPVPTHVRAPAHADALTPSAKGVWEPVPYGEDIDLNSVYFVSADEGWVTGSAIGGHAVLLHTVDAGTHWNVVLGDPAGSQLAYSDLRFVDAHTGFAVQKTSAGDHTLLRTVDGARWTASGTVPQRRQDYAFLSPTVGVAATGNAIVRTTDAGRTWTRVFDCSLKVSVGGLTRAARCEAAAFAFPTATTGYALGNSYDAKGLYLLRTVDAGNSWSVALAVPGADGREGHIVFTSEQTGYICTADGRLFGTQDGGTSWDGLPGAACPEKAALLFADPGVGWAVRYHTLTFTTDGGAQWASRPLALPAAVMAFSLPRRDRAYVVGPHGMVFRYRVVPETVSMPGAVAAPVMPGLPTTLATNVVQFQSQVGSLDAGLGAFVDPGSGTSAAPPSGGFTQDASSPFITSCCAAKVSSLQVVMTAIAGLAPEFTSKYRNLNLLTQGLRIATALPDAANNLKSALQAFRASGDKTAALTAMAQIKSLLATLRAQTDTAMQQPTFVQ